MNVGKEAKIYWISILQGWSMLLVVIGHVTLTNIFENPATPVSTEVERIIYGFHMPLFMFISGGLFYYKKIRKGKEVIGSFHLFHTSYFCSEVYI